jgi:hypothetical protein
MSDAPFSLARIGAALVGRGRSAPPALLGVGFAVVVGLLAFWLAGVPRTGRLC